MIILTDINQRLKPTEVTILEIIWDLIAFELTMKNIIDHELEAL